MIKNKEKEKKCLICHRTITNSSKKVICSSCSDKGKKICGIVLFAIPTMIGAALKYKNRK